ncbi:MAG: hypothetical protein F9K40_19975 [Kofleriaceae bacterium]|nr:MAG: hypothetical protein F9K40_19975 [Kofleriaceae bacterium]MBZ0235017.1 hypothetical protein [Kofleriaceae bacterium]
MKRGLVFIMGSAVVGCARPPAADPDALVPDAGATEVDAMATGIEDAAPVDGESTGGDAAPDGAQADGGVAADATSPVCGFATAASDWTLPAGAAMAGFGAFEGVNTLGRFRAVDLDGDRRPDIVWTHWFDDDTVGAMRWMRHPGVVGGFADDAVPWSLPATGGPFLYASDWGQYPSYDMLDLDGDARPELVVTFRGNGGPVGNQHWEVYRNEGTASRPRARRGRCRPGTRPTRSAWRAAPGTLSVRMLPDTSSSTSTEMTGRTSS